MPKEHPNQQVELRIVPRDLMSLDLPRVCQKLPKVLGMMKIGVQDHLNAVPPRKRLSLSQAANDTFSNGCSLVSPYGALKDGNFGVAKGIRWHLPDNRQISQTRRVWGASQIMGFRPLLEKTFPSIYRIFRASQNTKRWRINNTMFAKSQPLDARVMFFP